MDSTFAIMIAIVFFVIAMNFFMLFVRLKRDIPSKRSGKVMEKKDSDAWRDREIQRRLNSENEENANRVEMRNKTLELYEQVRKNAETNGKG